MYGHPDYYIKGGKRTGVMDTYYQTFKARSNSQVMMYTVATSIVRNGAAITGVRTNNTAIGGNGVGFNLALLHTWPSLIIFRFRLSH